MNADIKIEGRSVIIEGKNLQARLKATVKSRAALVCAQQKRNRNTDIIILIEDINIES